MVPGRPQAGVLRRSDDTLRGRLLLCLNYFTGRPDAPTVSAWLSLVLAFIVGILMEALLGLIGFWILEVSSLIFIYMMMNYFLSGHMIPLDWLPAAISRPVQLLPFKYLAYFPAAIMLHRYTHGEARKELLIELGWVIGLFALNRARVQPRSPAIRRFGG